MNTKQLRSKHRNLFTDVTEVKIGKDTYEKVRVHLANYVPFRQWIREMNQLEFDDLKATGKALEIRQGK